MKTQQPCIPEPDKQMSAQCLCPHLARPYHIGHVRFYAVVLYCVFKHSRGSNISFNVYE